MKIDIVCSSGSPTGIIPEDVEGRGVGGAELALVTTAEQWAKAGHDVVVYNNPKVSGIHGNVQYMPVGDWNRRRADVLIIFRTPFHGATSFGGLKVFWSCDQYTIGDYKTDVFPFVDKVVTISPFHTRYFMEHYDLAEEKIATIGIGVRTWEYERDVPKVPGRVIYCSVPDRGLNQLRQIWDRLVALIPNLSLDITSDYRLWGSPAPLNEDYRRKWQGVPNVNFYGKVSRAELVQLQLQAQWMLYPCIYDELFCIALAECQVAGVLPVTSNVGALSTTNVTGLIVPGNPQDSNWQQHYVEMVAASREVAREMYDPEQSKRIARHIFGFDVTLAAWDEVLP